MKELLVLRHAKSSWKHEGLDDHDRPLNRRGKRDAPRMGRWIRAHDLVPDAVLCSSAVRARTTAELVAGELGFAGSLQVVPDLYLSGWESYLSALALLPDRFGRALIVGHNPDVELLVEAVTGREVTMPTAALAHLRLATTSWRVRMRPAGKLADLWLPKELPERFV